MVRLMMIMADPDGPKFAKAHKKQENVWAKQYEQVLTPIDDLLENYPREGEEVVAWKEGKNLAQSTAISVGMGPTFFDETDDTDDTWFYKPFQHNSSTTEIMEEMSTEEEIAAPESSLVNEVNNGGTTVKTDDNDITHSVHQISS